jgi:Tfp pilus assembly protein PilO
MYFIPEKGRFYRWVVNTRPLYRYGITVGVLGALLVAWFFLLNPWLVGVVQYEQAALNRAVQEKQEACMAERLISLRSKQIEKADAAIQEIGRMQNEQDQIAFLFDAAQTHGLQIDTFSKEKEKRKEWRSKRYVSFSAHGALPQFIDFFTTIAQSSHMIQCKQLALQASENDRLLGNFQLASVSLSS